MSTFYARYQLEVRYHKLLNFNDFIAKIINPYFKLASDVDVIRDINTSDRYKLKFDEDKFTIDIWWDRAYILCQGPIENKLQTSSSFNLFFQILDKMHKHEEFIGFKNNLAHFDIVKTFEINNERELLTKFKSKYINENYSQFFDDISDYSFTVENGSVQKKLTGLTIGPFTKRDLSKHGLFPFGSAEILELESKYGLLIKLKLFEKSNQFTNDNFKEIVKTLNSISNKIEI